MSFREKLLSSYLAIGKSLFPPTVTTGPNVALAQRLNNFGRDTNVDKYRGLVYACMERRSNQVGKYEPVFYRLNGNQEQEVSTHALKRLIANPDKDVSQFDLLKVSNLLYMIYGEFFWYFQLGEITGLPKTINLIPPDRMGIDINGETGQINGYIYTRPDGTRIPFEEKEILHRKTYNPKNKWRGLSLIGVSRDYIDTEEYARDLTKNTLKNSGTMSGILTVGGQGQSVVNETTFDIFARRFREQYEGRENAGKLAMIRQGAVDFTKVGFSLGDADLAPLKRMTTDEVLLMFGLSRQIMGMPQTEGLSQGGFQTAELIFMKYTVDPDMDFFDETLQQMLVKFWPKDIGKGLLVKHENVIPADKEWELNLWDKGVDRWIKRNEIRGEAGLEDADGGDELRAPLTSTPIGSSTQTVTPAKSLKIKAYVRHKELSVEAKEAFRLSIQKNQEVYESEYLRVLKPILEAQEMESIASLELHGAKSLAKKENVQPLFDLSKATKAFEDSLGPLLASLTEEQGKLAMEFAGDDKPNFRITEEIRGFITESTKKIATSFNEETLKALNDALTEGILNGEGLSKMKKRIEEVYRGTKGYRAERLARTETLKASNNATVLAYKETGFVKQMQWYANPGACEFCRAMDGRIVGLNESFMKLGQNLDGQEGGSFLIDYEDIDRPPLHGNCRCGLVPVR